MSIAASLLPDSKQNRITITQFVLIIHSMQLGVAALSLPSDMARISGTDGWIALIFGWASSMLASLIVVQIMKKYPKGTIIELISHYFGKWIGRLAMVVFGLYGTLYAYLILDRMVLLIESWIMQQTQTYMLMVLFMPPAYLIIKGGVRVIGRYSEIVVFSSLWMLIILAILLREANWLHLLPVLKEGWMPVFRTVPTTILSFQGFEIVFFIYPNLDKKKYASLGVVIANTYTLLIYLFITIVCFVVYSPDQITQYNDAVISMVKIIEFRFMERFDIIMLTWYLLIISKTWIPALYMSVYCTKQLFSIGKLQWYIVAFLVGMCLTTMILNPGWNENAEALKWFSSLGIAIAFAFPACLWCVLSVMLKFKRWQA
ncbi:GerAB/ArcD/ProY family transporter [Paenibacillus rhizovicinus]|uniref:GerAB/ArcD/ProY family transporter n=1 Tax=Paenibacillus rhizovicinus TaxID=2704463 RepID=A0A6C0P8C7_9BACL|nr:GerAB/ArcD/ProY family transporter [Paenibacillus rhizovicinus]QHW34666.1 GerAB/ArcD/ProY family transporter [Paenibacillus rhizovicinus]